MASSKPAVVIVPGAWHPPALYETLETALDKAGYTALTASLPSLDSQDPQATSCSADADTVRQYIMRLIETDGKDVVVLCHSYGGIPGGGAAHGLSKTSRVQRGQKGGVIGLVYLTAFVVPEKASLLQIMGGKHAPYLVPDKPSEGLCSLQGARDAFFNDLDDERATQLVKSLLPHSMRVFDSSAPPPAWADEDFAGKIAFIRCTADQALPLFLQNMFMENSGVKWNVREIESSHSPFISQPQKVVELLSELASQFAH